MANGTEKFTAYGKLTYRRLVAFGIPAADALKIIDEGRIAHRWGPKKRDVEYLDLARFMHRPGSYTFLFGLELAEHIARVFHNWKRSYHVDTTRLAMSARDAA